MLGEGRLGGVVQSLCGRSDNIIYQSPSKKGAWTLIELHGSFICKNWQPWIASPVHLEWKIILFLLKPLNSYRGVGNRIAHDWLGDQLVGLWCPFCLVVLISHQRDESFLPSKEQSVFVNWAAGVLIGSSVWLHRSVSCSLYFLDMLPWRWKLTLMPNRKTWCFIRSTSRSMTMSGKNSSLSPSHGEGGTLPFPNAWPWTPKDEDVSDT